MLFTISLLFCDGSPVAFFTGSCLSVHFPLQTITQKWEFVLVSLFLTPFQLLPSCSYPATLETITLTREQIKRVNILYYRWLDYLLSRIIFQAKAFVKNASRAREEVVQKINQILLRLVSIEKQQTLVMADLKKYLKTREDAALLCLSVYLSSEEVKTRFTSWTLDEVPKAERSWEVTENQIRKVLSRRLREIIEQWEEDNQVFANARDSLVQHFQQRYNFVEEQLRNLQGAVTADNVDVPQNNPNDFGFTLGEKVVIGVTSPVWFPLGLVALVIGVPVVGVMAIKEKLEDRKHLKKYEADKCAFMAKESAEYLDAANNDYQLRSFVEDQLEDARLCLKQIEARIPELIQADKVLCDELIDERRSKKEIEDLYQPIMDEGSCVRGQLAVFGILEVRTNDITSEELVWKENTSSRLGCGMFGAVYQGTMRRHGVVQPVALKVCNDVLDDKNASDIMAEVELLR